MSHRTEQPITTHATSGCNLTREDFDPADPPCPDGGLPAEHPPAYVGITNGDALDRLADLSWPENLTPDEAQRAAEARAEAEAERRADHDADAMSDAARDHTGDDDPWEVTPCD